MARCYYEVRYIGLIDRGEWWPKELVWRGRSRSRAEEVADAHAWDTDLGTCIVTVQDGRPVSIDWGDRTEMLL
jgi:hypothetical protein